MPSRTGRFVAASALGRTGGRSACSPSRAQCPAALAEHPGLHLHQGRLATRAAFSLHWFAGTPSEPHPRCPTREVATSRDLSEFPLCCRRECWQGCRPQDRGRCTTREGAIGLEPTTPTMSRWKTGLSETFRDRVFIGEIAFACPRNALGPHTDHLHSETRESD